MHTAFQLVRSRGLGSVNARSLAEALQCSTKPLFRIYKNMDELKNDLLTELDLYYNAYMESRITEENRLLSQGLAYIAFARNEKMIFKALFMNRAMEGFSLRDLVHAEWNRRSIENARTVTGLPADQAEELFINIWLYAHGIATQIVSNGVNLSGEEATGLLADAFRRFSMDRSLLLQMKGDDHHA